MKYVLVISEKKSKRPSKIKQYSLIHFYKRKLVILSDTVISDPELFIRPGAGHPARSPEPQSIMILS